MSTIIDKHFDIYCNECKDVILDVRYMCLDCEDYDLCEICEDDPDIRQLHHDGLHLQAKVYNSKRIGGEEILNQYRTVSGIDESYSSSTSWYNDYP